MVYLLTKKGIDENLLNQTKRKIGINYNQENIDLAFLVFSSPSVNSLDMLTKQTNFNSIVIKQQFSKGNIIYMDKNSLIYKEDAKTIKIVFLLTNTEMQKANGFFDYKDKDTKIIERENWFNITSIKTD